MPYRHAQYWLLALFPLIVIAFWPGYFGHLGDARMAQHMHGMTATAWLALLAAQSWSAHGGRLAWHRASGLAVFAIVPLFAAAGVYGVRDMAAEMSRGSPFEAFAAPGLAPADLISIVALVGFVAAALATRRRLRRHAAWMLATALLVLPPMTTRLVQVLARSVGLGAPSFLLSFILGEAVTAIAALVLARSHPREATPFVIVVVLGVTEFAAYAVLRTSVGWRVTLAAFGASPPLPSALAAAALALATLILAWRRVPSRSPAAAGPPIPREGATAG